jgi:hypothetical protein
MAEPQTLLALLLMGALALWQVRRHARGAAERRAWRAAYLDEVRPLLANPRGRVEPNGFARLSGRAAGLPIDLRAIPDTLATRKLPALWLMATLPDPMPLEATWHLMLRPRGAETFSAFDRLPRLLPPVPGLPEDSALRTDAPAGAPPPLVLDLMAETVAALGEERMKEVVLSPRGLRLTWLAEEAPRARYIAFRDCEMGRRPLDPATLAPILDSLLRLHAALAPEPARRRA